MIAHPPCTYLSVSGLHWNKRDAERAKKTEEALEFVQYLMDAPIEKIAIENPISCISTRIRKPDQIIQPYDFGDDASKKTCLWLKNLPPLVSTKRVQGRFVEYNIMSNPVLSIDYQEAYTSNIEFDTQINEKALGREQRYSKRTYPKRTFTLKFDKDSTARQDIETFFENVS